MRVKERRSLSYITIPPLLIKERGIKGVRLINNLQPFCTLKAKQSCVVKPGRVQSVCHSLTGRPVLTKIKGRRIYNNPGVVEVI
jgi:hypothetical protein